MPRIKANTAYVTKASDLALVTFEQDKATIFQAFRSLIDFDWKTIGALLMKYQGDKKKFEEVRLVCREFSIARVLTKAGITHSETEVAELARLDGTKPEHKEALAKLSEAKKAARKGAANDWFGFTARIGYKTLEARGGARNVTGANGSTPRPASNTPVAPVTVESYVAAELGNLMALKSTYMSVGSLLVKLQARNAKLYIGDEGNKLLAIHKNIVELLKGITLV